MKPFAGFTHHVETVRGVPLHYRTAGRGEPVLLLHGWPQHSLHWMAVAEDLAENYFVIVPDLPGCGGSGFAPDGYDKRTVAGYIADLVAGLGVAAQRVVGYDHGAGVAYQYAHAQPERVRQLVFVEYVLPGCGYEQIMQPTADWHTGSNWQLALFSVPDVAEFAFRGRERELLTWFFWHGACNPSAVKREHLEEYVDQISKPGALRAGIEYYATVWKDLEINREAMTTKLTVPALGIGGRHSIAEYVGGGLSAVVESAQTRVIEHAGHWICDENPAELVRLLREFFAESAKGSFEQGAQGGSSGACCEAG